MGGLVDGWVDDRYARNLQRRKSINYSACEIPGALPFIGACFYFILFLLLLPLLCAEEKLSKGSSALASACLFLSNDA